MTAWLLINMMVVGTMGFVVYLLACYLWDLL